MYKNMKNLKKSHEYLMFILKIDNTMTTNLIRTFLLSACLMVSFLQNVTAQSEVIIKKITPNKNQQWEFGLLGGVRQYNGDLNKLGSKENNLALGGAVRYHLSNTIAARINFTTGNLSGSDANSTINQARNLRFVSGAREVALLGEFDLLGNRRYAGGSFSRKISPYINGGLAMAFFAPDVYYNSTNDKAQKEEDANKSFMKSNIAVPIGAGLKIDLSEKWVLNLEAGYRVLFTDYIDGVSQLGDPNKADAYAYAGTMLSYRIPVVMDSDKDGVKDSEDACPNLKGPKGTRGCPDADGDGVFDHIDRCPNDKGTTETKGCPDADADGLSDKEDVCPYDKGTPQTKGCPDTDSDGVIDRDDRCPSLAGSASQKGCPDTDGDGIVDLDDPCPNERGGAESNGCPEKDSDSDGVTDSNDKCPTEKGDRRNGGCPFDSDGDGIVDGKDGCPKIAGPARTNGCPDRDNDGVDDYKDACPDTYGATAKGCPPVAEKDQKILESAIYGVQFESGNERLKKQSYSVLDNIADVMERNSAYNLEIRGHTDNVGDEEGNQQLSVSRAKSCYNYLLSKGVPSARMAFFGFGETQPVADNDSNVGKAKNRRVEFELK
jgi:OmpA-OmpF porin, OOP family